MSEIINYKQNIILQASLSGIEFINQHYKSKKNNVVAIKVDGVTQDLRDDINQHAKTIEIIDENHKEALDVIRHDCAHILAQALLKLDNKIQFGVGPTTEIGCYYDFISPTSTIKENQLPIIEDLMNRIVSENHQITRSIISKQDAIEFFSKNNQPYKVELVKKLEDHEKITLYKQGDFIDLCKGPHGLNTGYIKHFKILSMSGVYWKNDKQNPMMQRIYVTAWNSKKALSNYLYLREESIKRDHRKIGKELELFHFEEHSPGMVFWHPNGFKVFNLLKNYIRKKQDANGYTEVQTPILCSEKLWMESGHIAKFKENMFFTSNENSEHKFAAKPMNCPCHIEIFKQGIKSYKELPIRMAEFGKCHRKESSGALHGLMRVQNLTQDDAHIFCTEEQILEESILFLKMVIEIYKELGFNEVFFKLSTRPKIRLGDDQIWDLAEKSLSNALNAIEVQYETLAGEGAFYGPKIECHLKDALQRGWQCGTLQLDFLLAKKLNAFYVASDNTKKHPVILHRAILGTIERFMGILIEHYKGRFPMFLAPLQVIVVTITSDCNEYALKITKQLAESGIRTTVDIENNTISHKIRKWTQKKVPIIAIIGQHEMANEFITLRLQGNKNQKCSIDELIHKIKQEERT